MDPLSAQTHISLPVPPSAPPLPGPYLQLSSGGMSEVLFSPCFPPLPTPSRRKLTMINWTRARAGPSMPPSCSLLWAISASWHLWPMRARGEGAFVYGCVWRRCGVSAKHLAACACSETGCNSVKGPLGLHAGATTTSPVVFISLLLTGICLGWWASGRQQALHRWSVWARPPLTKGSEMVPLLIEACCITLPLLQPFVVHLAMLCQVLLCCKSGSGRAFCLSVLHRGPRVSLGCRSNEFLDHAKT